MKKRLISFMLVLTMVVFFVPSFALKASAATAPTKLWVAPSAENCVPAQIDGFYRRIQTGVRPPTYKDTYELYLPGSASIENCFLSWDGDAQAVVGDQIYESGSCPIPSVGVDNTETYTFKDGDTTLASFEITTYQGSANVEPVFIEIDESDGKPTIAQMDGDPDHEVTCSGTINIAGKWYVLEKMKGRGNASWERSDDKKPYNITLGKNEKKINFPGIDSKKTRKWSLLAEVLDHSLMCNRSGYHLAHELGIGQDTASADVWMNGEYQGCYTVTPKTDSFVTDDGYMIEQDNYKEKSVAQGGDPQFTLDGLKEASGWDSCYNRITVKKMGDNLLMKDGEVDESPENMEAAASEIQSWLQDAWDAIRADGTTVDFGYGKGYNSKGKYYTDYIDIESFAKMYLMHEYVKSYDVCAGSILFHRDGQTDNDKLIAGPIWDLDNAMGSVYQNSSLGKADDRRNGDRRSGEGDFISNVTEYKTSIYKTLSQHDDFMDEVRYQYNKYRAEFDQLSDDVELMRDDIAASAMMNHYKVNEIGPATTYRAGYNNHRYTGKTTLGGADYQQTYLQTISSKEDWPNYVANLITYITTRSLWFHNQYYDPDFCDHTYEENVTTAPTCTEEGEATYTCTKCGDTYTNTIPATGHSFDDIGICTVCQFEAPRATITCGAGASVTVYKTQDTTGECVENATFANPRSSDTGQIDISGDGQINFVVNLQSGYELVSVTAEPKDSYKNLKGPEDTGIVNGYRLTKVKGDLTITVTTRCVHDYKAIITEPTCTQGGYTTYTCSRCGDSYVDDQVNALGHNLTKTNKKDATCTEAGNNAYWSCDRCGKFFSDEECEHEITENSWVINAFGHNKEAHEAVAPTCTEAGNSAYWSCDRCGKYFSDEACDTEIEADSWVLSSTGHVAGDPVKENEEAATCTAEGSYDEVVYCTVCEEELSRETKTVEALGHHKEAHEAAAPTCTKKGNSAYWSCDRCRKYFSDEECENEIEKDSWVIDELGHKAGDPVRENEKAATCTAEGSYDEVVYCTVCEEELSRETKSISKIDHTPVTIPAVSPTCTEAGSTGGSKCSVCGETLIAPQTVPATGHTEVTDAAVEATCTETGLAEGKHCSVCNEVLVAQKEVAALGHNWSDWEVVKEATTTEEGVEERTCSRCEKKETQSIPAIKEDGVMRIYGATRYETSIKVAEELKEKLGKDKFDAVILADGRNYPDALAGSYLSCVREAPIILVDNKNDHISAAQAYIKENLKSGGTIYMLGGEAAVPEKAVAGLSGDKVRLGGKDRYETNIKILKEAGNYDKDASEYLVCSGTGFADSLSAAAVGKPIILIKTAVQDNQKEYINSLKGKKFYIIGGAGAVDPKIENVFKGLGDTTRLGGATRYETSVKVAERFFKKPSAGVLAYGKNFPDGLCGGALAKANNGPLVLTEDTKKNVAADYAAKEGMRSGYVLGGPTLINDDSARAIYHLDDDVIIEPK